MRPRDVDGGHVLRAMMRDARRLVGVSHVNVCPVMAACFDDTVSGETPVCLVYSASTTSVYLKTLLDKSRQHDNVC